MKNKLRDIFDIAPGLPLHFIEALPFDQRTKNLLEYPMPNSLLIKKLLRLKKIVSYPYKCSSISDEPKYFHFCCSPNDIMNPDMGDLGGAMTMSAEISIIKSLGECIERYSLRNLPKKFLIKKLRNLKKLETINIEDFLNFTDNFLKNEGRAGRLSKIRNARLRFVRGINAITRKPAFIPAQLVYVPTKKNIFLDEPIIRWPISTGAAFGINQADAIYRAILECIERDSLMIRYLSKYNAPKIVLNTDITKEIKEDFESYNLKIHLFDFTTDIGVCTIVAIITDDSGIEPFQTIGSKADLNPEKAAMGAILEAYQSRYAMRFNLDNVKVEKLRDITDLKTRILYWSRKNMRKHLDYLLKSKSKKFLTSLPNYDKEDNRKNVNFLLKKLKQKEIEAYIVDITPASVKKQGFSVVKAIVPKLHPLYLLESIPHKYSERLEKNGGIKNRITHPFP